MKKRMVLLGTICFLLMLIGCRQNSASSEYKMDTVAWEELKYKSSMELLYAENFSVDYYEGGYALITIKEGGKYLVVPEQKPIPKGLEKEMTVLQKPLDTVYLTATSAMDLFCAIDGLSAIGFSGTDADGWYIPQAKEAMKKGKIKYAGKYSMPDYELLLSEDCDLAIESTMIYHTPEVKEKLEEVGIPVLIERSSYEPHPLGRMEWIKLYGVLLGKETLAEEKIKEQTEKLNEILNMETKSQKTVAFFYISQNGYANVRRAGDYISKMIELAGGKYIFDETEQQESALSSINMQMEYFYEKAKMADILIYNSTIDGELKSLEDLLKKSPLLKDFKAVKTGNVWCTTKNMFQETMSLGDMILDFYTIMQPDIEKENLKYLYPLV